MEGLRGAEVTVGNFPGFFLAMAFKWNDMGSPLKHSLLKKWVDKLGVKFNSRGVLNFTLQLATFDFGPIL